MLKKIMKRAHQLAKGFEGNYQARLSLALKLAWKEEKEMDRKLVIAKWWLDKNPAIDVIFNEFDNVEITKETEKAYHLNNEIWIPKSVVSFEEIAEEEISKDKVQEAFSNLETSQRIRIRREASKKFKNNEDYSGNIYEDVKFYNYLADEMKINGYKI